MSDYKQERCAYCHCVRTATAMFYIKQTYFCCVEHYRKHFGIK